MNGTMKRVAFGIGAAVVAVSMAGGAFAAGQNIGAGQGPAFGGVGQGGFGGRGGPGRGGPMGPGPGGMLGPMMLQRLNLTDAQKERVKGILDSHQEELKALGNRAMAARRALEDAVASDTFDEATVRTRSAETAMVEADMTVARARIYSEVFQSLTADQQTQLKQLRADMRKRAADRQANRQDRRAQRQKG
jgi:Spy/CpxP family protein refolding chaperone